MSALQLSPAQLTLAVLRQIWSQPVTLAVDPAAKRRVDAAAAAVDRIVASGKTVYGEAIRKQVARGDFIAFAPIE